MLKRYLIERNITDVGMMNRLQLQDAASASNAALAKLMPRIQWQHSYVTKDKTFCIYLAEDEAVIHEHAKLSGFPANKITQIGGIIDPATASG